MTDQTTTSGQPSGHIALTDQNGRLFLADILNRTDTAMTQAHCFLASELALRAQAQARPIEGKRN